MPRIYKHKTADRRHASHKPQTLPPKFQAGFLASLDKRTDLARALQANYAAVVNDVGGHGNVSRIQNALIERFVWLEAILQTLEHEMATGQIDKQDAIGKWAQLVNTLSGLARVLGVERKATARPWCSVQPAESTELAEVGQ